MALDVEEEKKEMLNLKLNFFLFGYLFKWNFI